MFDIKKVFVKLANRQGMCDNVSDDTLERVIYASALEIGLQNFRSYSEVAQSLRITESYLRKKISDLDIEPYHHLRLGNRNLLSIDQVKLIKQTIKCATK